VTVASWTSASSYSSSRSYISALPSKLLSSIEGSRQAGSARPVENKSNWKRKRLSVHLREIEPLQVGCINEGCRAIFTCPIFEESSEYSKFLPGFLVHELLGVGEFGPDECKFLLGESLVLNDEVGIHVLKGVEDGMTLTNKSGEGVRSVAPKCHPWFTGDRIPA
jgi:hypothetical protein